MSLAHAAAVILFAATSQIPEGGVVMTMDDIDSGALSHYFLHRPAPSASGRTTVLLSPDRDDPFHYYCKLEVPSVAPRVDGVICGRGRMTRHLVYRLHRLGYIDIKSPQPLRLHVDWSWSDQTGLGATIRFADPPQPESRNDR